VRYKIVHSKGRYYILVKAEIKTGLLFFQKKQSKWVKTDVRGNASINSKDPSHEGYTEREKAYEQIEQWKNKTFGD